MFCARTRDLFQLLLRGQLQIISGYNRSIPVPSASEFRLRKLSREIFRPRMGKAQHNVMPQNEIDRMQTDRAAFDDVAPRGGYEARTTFPGSHQLGVAGLKKIVRTHSPRVPFILERFAVDWREHEFVKVDAIRACSIGTANAFKQ